MSGFTGPATGGICNGYVQEKPPPDSPAVHLPDGDSVVAA
jgi:hypothetical protein